MKHNNLITLAISILLGLFIIFEAPQSIWPKMFAIQAAEPKTHVVAIRKSQFSPASITVAPGDTIVFRNYDIVPHTATGSAFNSGNLDKGKSWSYVAGRKGSFPYICSYHPSMKGRVVVR